MKGNGLLYEGFLRSVRQFPKRLALEVENRVIKYSDLQQRALRVARTLQKLCATDQPPLDCRFWLSIGDCIRGRSSHTFPRTWLRSTKPDVSA